MNTAQISAIADRFWPKVRKTDGCWLWTGSIGTRGYGSFKFVIDGKRMQRASRASWLLEHGTLDPALEICHHCDNPICVRPSHLFAGTHSENIQDMIRKGYRTERPGAANHKAKLTEQQVIEIRGRSENNCAVAREYGLTNATVSKLRRRITWRHI